MTLCTVFTKSAEVEAETPLGVDVLELLFKHFDVADGVEHDVDDDGQSHKACDAHPRRIQQVRQRHELNIAIWCHAGASISMGLGDMSPQYLGRGTSMVMSPQYFRSDVVYDVDSSDSNCCLLYFNANIMCSFTKKASASGGLRPPNPLPGLCPWTSLREPSFMSPQ